MTKTIDTNEAKMNIRQKLIAIQGELKSPKTQVNTFGKYNYRKAEDILEAVKPEYYWQMQSEMDCTEASTGHFVAFNPYMKEPMHIATIERCQEDIDIIHERIALAEEYISNNIIK